MKISDGPELASQEKMERRNIGEYLEALSQWTYQYIHTGNKHVLTRVRARYKNGSGTIEKNALSPEEVGIVALASRYYKPQFPQGNSEAEQEFAEYQFQLQQYLGITSPELVIRFYEELVRNVKPEHNKLIPILHTHHAQIHALKIAYDTLKGKVSKGNPAVRAIFGLVCIELMKLHVRLYLVEPLARGEEGKDLDWITMLDTVFDDFTFDPPDEAVSLKRKHRPNTREPYSELGLRGILQHIKDIRDEVDRQKREKHGILEERKTINLRARPYGYMRIIRNVQGGVHRLSGRKSTKK